jgi:hypothetical protein
MDSQISYELKEFPSTLSHWTQIIQNEKTFHSFHNLIQTFLTEIESYPNIEVNLTFFYKELITFTCKGLKSSSPETKDLLKAVQLCLKRKIFSKDKLEEFVFSLKKFFEGLMTISQNTCEFQLIQESFKCLASLSSQIIYIENRESFEEDLISSIVDVAKWVSKKNNPNFDSDFLISLNELTKTGNLAIFINCVLKRKCILVILDVLKRVLFDSVLFGEEEKDVEKEKKVFEFFYFLVENYEDLEDLCLEEIVSQLQANRSSFGFFIKFFNILLLSAAKNTESSLRYRRKIIELAMNVKLESEVRSHLFKELKKFEWGFEKISRECKKDLKNLVLSGRYISECPFFIDLISPCLSEEFTVQDLKQMTRLSSRYQSMTLDFFSCLIETAQSNRENFTYFQVSKENFLLLSPNYKIQRENELSIWIRFSLIEANSDHNLMILELNNNKQLIFSINSRKLSAHLVKNNEKTLIFNFDIILQEKEWALLGIQFWTRLKKEGKKKISLFFNDFSSECMTNEFNKFNTLKSLKFESTCRLEFVKVFNCCLGKEMIFGQSSKELIKNAVVVKFDQKYLMEKGVTCYAVRVKKLHLIDIVLTAGNINLFLPLLRKSEDLQVFGLFFKLLSEFSLHKRFEELFDEKTFPVLRQIMIEKAYIVSMDWLEMCEKFFEMLKSFRVYKDALENLYLNIGLWSNLLDNCLMYYLEAVKNRIKGLKCELTDDYLLLITNYFINLAIKVDASSHKLVFYYLFQILFMFFKHIDPAIKLKKFSLVLQSILKYYKSFKISDEISRFINELGSQKFTIQSESLLEQFLSSFSSIESLPIEVYCVLLSFYLNRIRKYFNINIAIKPLNLRREFIVQTVNTLTWFIKDKIHSLVFKTFIDFLNSPKINNSELSLFVYVLIFVLDTVDLNENTEVYKCFEVICEEVEKSKKLSMMFTSQVSFPGFLFKFFTPWDNINKNTVLLIESFFSYFENFVNLNDLRKIVFELISTHNNSTAFDIMQKILSRNFQIIDSKNLKLFIDFCNIVEDLSAWTQYNEITAKNYFDLIIPVLNHISSIEFSYNLEINPDLNTKDLNYPARNNEKTSQRVGGLCRQSLLFSFIALRLHPNSEIESFFNQFLKNPRRDSQTFLDWSEISQESKKISKIIENSKNTENLIALYIYFEWLETIYSYKEKNISNDLIFQSTNNLFCFGKAAGIEEKMQKEAKFCLGNRGINKYEEFLYENKEIVDSLYLKDSQNRIKDYMESILTKSSQSNLLIKILEYSVKLESCTNLTSFQKFLINTSEQLEIFTFFFMITSLKLNKISSYYTSQTPNNTYSLNVPEAPALQPLLQDPHIKINPDHLFLYYYRILEKEHIYFCGLIETESEGDVTLRKIKDNLGRPIFTKKKKSNEFYSIDSLFYSQNYSITPFRKSISAINLMESSISEDSYFESPTFADLGFIINSETNNKNFEYECEVITNTGCLYGTFFIYEDFIVFISKTTKKPAFNPIVVENNQKILYSFALPDMQIMKQKTNIWNLSEVKNISLRRFVHNYSAIEINFLSSKSTFINFYSYPRVLAVWSKLKRVLTNPEIFELPDRDIRKITEKWQTGQISNFEYLMTINNIAGRSFNDLNQYPIFPWVIQDFSSKTINFDNPSQMRDFKYPLGSQEEENRKKFIQGPQQKDLGVDYHYGCYYSCCGGILDFLIRIQPFTSENKKINQGQFDLPDRIFSNLKKTWNEVKFGMNSNREMIPEFFYLPEMFLNSNNEDFKVPQRGGVISNVKLPKWTNGDCYLFISKHAKALESEYVSQNLHDWIDLVFGYKQNGESAWRALNLYHPITYFDKYQKVIKVVPADLQRPYYEQAYHFGQIPFQLFTQPHPSRHKQISPKSILESLINDQNEYFPRVLKKHVNPSPILVLVSSVFLIALRKKKGILVSKFILRTLKNYDKKKRKKFYLAGVSNPTRLMAVLVLDSVLVTAGYEDISIALHDLNGVFIKSFKLHSMRCNELVGGNWIISASEDSTLALALLGDDQVQDVGNCKFKKLHGHLSPVVSVSGIYKSSIIASCSTYVLVHHSLSCKVLYKIEETSSKVICSSTNMIYLKIFDQIKIFYMNGKHYKSYYHDKFKPFFVFNDYLILEELDSLKVLTPLQYLKETIINFGESLDILQVLSCQTGPNEHKQEFILVINSNNSSYSIFSIEAVPVNRPN